MFSKYFLEFFVKFTKIQENETEKPKTYKKSAVSHAKED